MKTADIITALQRSGRDTLQPSVRDRIRSSIVQEFHSVRRDRDVRFTPLVRTSYQLSPMIASLVAVMIFAAAVGTTLAAEGAKPGDPLYHWDRGVEQVRLSLTVGSEARAKYQAKLAEERIREVEDLEHTHVEITATVRQDTDIALKQAIEAVVEVKHKQKVKGNVRASQALQNVEERLKELKERQREKLEKKKQEVEIRAKASGLTEAQATIRGNVTTIEIEFNDEDSEFTVNVTTEADIVRAIMERIGVAEAEVRKVLEIERDDEKGEGRDSGTVIEGNANASVEVDLNIETNRKNINQSIKRSESRGGSSAEANVNVEVNTQEGKAHVETVVNGKEQRLDLLP